MINFFMLILGLIVIDKSYIFLNKGYCFVLKFLPKNPGVDSLCSASASVTVELVFTDDTVDSVFEKQT